MSNENSPVEYVSGATSRVIIEMGKRTEPFTLTAISDFQNSRSIVVETFNEMLSLGAVCSLKQRMKGGDAYMINTGVLVDLLINIDPDAVMGQKFYKVSLGKKTYYSRFLNDEMLSDENLILDDACNLVQKLSGQSVDVDMEDVTILEVENFDYKLEYKKLIEEKESQENMKAEEEARDLEHEQETDDAVDSLQNTSTMSACGKSFDLTTRHKNKRSRKNKSVTKNVSVKHNAHQDKVMPINALTKFAVLKEIAVLT